MATTKIINDLIDLNQTGNTTALKGCVGDNAQQPATPTISVQYLVVGGGGAAGGGSSGGGGAGGLSTGTIAVPNNTAVNIVIGQGGVATTYNASSQPNGQDSGFYTIQGQGGGAGRYRNTGQPGGSGGGGGNNNPAVLIAGGNGVSGQGNNGGSSTTAQTYITGGGGGAGAVGDNAIVGTSGDGGAGSDAVALGIITQANGITANIGEVNGATLNFAGGGGGGGSFNGTGLKGSGGLGGGGDGSQADGVIGSSGTANTGGGAGGGHLGAVDSMGGNGGSGVVILKYASTATETIAGSLAGGITTGTTGTCDYPTTASALYQLNDNVTDTCGNYTAAGANITYTTGSGGKFGEAAIFNGTSSSINTGFAQNTSNAFSWSLWFNADSLQSGLALIIDTTSSSSPYPGVGIGLSSNTELYAFWSGTTSATFATITSNTWVHTVLTNDGSGNFSFYVNGSAIFTNVSQTTNIYSGQNILLGDTVVWNKFKGEIDQVRIFPSELTADQIAMLYAENVGATKFDDGTNTTLVFKGGSGTINLTSSSVLGPKVGDLRTNTDQTSASSASAMEHFISTGWRIINNSSLSSVNFPTVNNGVGLFQLNGDLDNTAGGAATMFTGAAAYSNTAKFGSQSINFTGSSAIDTGIAATNSFTISYWIYRNSTSFLYSYGTTDGNLYNGYNMGLYNSASNGKLDFVIRNLSFPQTNIGRTQGGATSNGQWYHIALTHSGTGTVGAYGTNTLYLNASLVTNTLTGQPYTTGNPVTGTPSNPENHIFGASGAWAAERFDGFMDQIRIYNTALTASQVTQLYNES